MRQTYGRNKTQRGQTNSPILPVQSEEKLELRHFNHWSFSHNLLKRACISIAIDSKTVDQCTHLSFFVHRD